jgi:hypothetical protein
MLGGKHREVAMVWHIEGWDSTKLIFERDVPGNMSEGEIETILQRLVARHLTPDEIVDASLRKNAHNRSSLLDRIGQGRPIHFGENPYYVANRNDD